MYTLYTELLTSEHVATVSYFQPLFHSPLFLIAFLCPPCFQRPSESIISKGLGKHFLLFSRFTTNVNAVVFFFFLHPKKCTRDIFKVYLPMYDTTIRRAKETLDLIKESLVLRETWTKKEVDEKEKYEEMDGMLRRSIKYFFSSIGLKVMSIVKIGKSMIEEKKIERQNNSIDCQLKRVLSLLLVRNK